MNDDTKIKIIKRLQALSHFCFILGSHQSWEKEHDS